MSYGGYGYGPGPSDPYGSNPYGSKPPGYGGYGAPQPGYGQPRPAYGAPPSGYGQPGYGPPPSAYGQPAPGYGAQPPGYGLPPPNPPGPPSGPVNTLATLSVVFAFVFAPAGAVLGHLALSQIKRRPQPGRSRAVLGTVLSYIFIVFGVLALVVWLVVAPSDGGGSTSTSTPTSKAGTRALPTPKSPRPTPSTPRTRPSTPAPPPQGRPTVTVDELHAGDCIEIQEGGTDPNKPGATNVTIYRASCRAGDGIYRVLQVVPNQDQCPATTKSVLYNGDETIFACMTKYGQ